LDRRLPLSGRLAGSTDALRRQQKGTQMPQGRKLTKGEESLCERVFKDSINARNIEVVRRPKTMKFGGFTPYGRVNMDGSAYRDDYVGENFFNPPDKPAAHHFLHELAHAWQHFVGMGMMHLSRLAQKSGRELLAANGMPRRPDGMTREQWSDKKFDAVYSYDISSGSDLMDFTMEQQCDIIADYFALTLWKLEVPDKAWGYATPTQLQLEGVLAKFLADRFYPRYLKRINNARAAWRMEER
jgi:hypothetical protein